MGRSEVLVVIKSINSTCNRPTLLSECMIHVNENNSYTLRLTMNKHKDIRATLYTGWWSGSSRNVKDKVSAEFSGLFMVNFVECPAEIWALALCLLAIFYQKLWYTWSKVTRVNKNGSTLKWALRALKIFQKIRKFRWFSAHFRHKIENYADN